MLAAGANLVELAAAAANGWCSPLVLAAGANLMELAAGANLVELCQMNTATSLVKYSLAVILAWLPSCWICNGGYTGGGVGWGGGAVASFPHMMTDTQTGM